MNFLFLWRAASVADNAAVNLNGMSKLLAFKLLTFSLIAYFITLKVKEVYDRNSPSCIILEIFVFDILGVPGKLFAKAWQISAIFLPASNTFYGKIVLLLDLLIIFDDNLKVTSLFTANFNLLSREFDNFRFTLLYWFILC